MTDHDKRGSDGLDRKPTPAHYRALILKPDGAVIRMEPLSVQTDDEALGQARKLVDGHAVELWDGMRYIEYFPPVD